MTRKFLAFIAIAIFFPGCHAILLKMYGIKDPKVETAQSIRKYALKQGLDTSLIASVSPADFRSVLKMGSGIPDAVVFDRDGAYIEYRATDTSCNAGLFAFIPSLQPGKDYQRTNRTTLQVELAKLRTLDGKMFTERAGDKNFYLLIYWTKWTGRLNKDHVKEWQDLAKANGHISVIEVNLDLQSWWTKEEQDRVMDIMSKKK